MPKQRVNTVELRFQKEKKQFLDNRRRRFSELLGEDSGYIESLVTTIEISPWDIQDLLDIGCPKDLAPKILL